MAVNVGLFFVWTSLLFSVFVNGLMIPDPEQISTLQSGHRIDESASNGKNYSKIAIIGSGITGASAAFRLAETYRRRLAPPGQQPIITVFEKNEIVGGRITQAYAYNDSRYPIDICAATFSIQDFCVTQSAASVGLSVLPVNLNDPYTRGSGVGVWNGNEFVGFVEEEMFRQPNLWSLYRQLKWYKRYGDNPWASSADAFLIRSGFSMLLPPPFSPIVAQPGQPNLKESVMNAGLEYYVQNVICALNDPSVRFPSGEKGALFVDEVLTAAQRERFLGSVFDLNVLEFLLGYEDQMESAIQGGNIQLIERQLRIATTDVRLGREVKTIERQLTGDFKLTSESTSDGSTSEDSFDAVVIATSFDRSNLTFEPPLEGVNGLTQPYVDSFVTHFTTPSLLNGSYFNRTGTMPQNVYTTLSVGDAFDGKEEPLFFSLLLLRRLQSPDTGKLLDYLFKLTSREEIPEAEIEKMLLTPNQPNDQKITWIDKRPFPQSIPITEAYTGQCKVLLENVEIAPNVFYAGGGEQVIGSAEFGCRMGTNAASLILDGAI
jgi:hypothetical protein